MRYLISAGALLLVAFLGQSEGAGEKKGEPSQPWAQVTVGGEIRDLLELRSKVDVLALLDRDIPMATVSSQWRGPLPPRAPQKGTAHVRSMAASERSPPESTRSPRRVTRESLTRSATVPEGSTSAISRRVELVPMSTTAQRIGRGC